MKRIPISLEGLLPQERLVTATVLDLDDTGTIRIGYAGDDEPIVASIAVPIGKTARDLVRFGDDVLVLLRDGDRNKPVIVSTIAARLEPAMPEPEQPAEPEPAKQEAIKLEADRELVLECGEASISLHADGRIIVRGGYVETYAEGTNRIKGAQVRIN